MKILLSTVLLAMIPLGSLAAGERFACDMKALTKTDREAYQKLSRTLFAAVQEKRELPNGYSFRLPPGTLLTVAKWVEFERKCCPFFTFDVEVARDNGPLWLRVTGADGVKAFIRAEFQLDS